MLLPLRVSFRSATCQLSYSSVAMLTDSAEPSSSRMKPCCLPNWAGTGSSHVLTKRGIICLSMPSLTIFFSIVAAYSGVAGLPAHPASTRAAAGRGRSIVLLSMAFLLLSRACGRPPCGTLRRMRSLMPPSYRALTLRVPQSHTAKHLQCLRLPFLESPSRRAHLPENKSGPRSEGLRTRKADENVEG